MITHQTITLGILQWKIFCQDRFHPSLYGSFTLLFRQFQADKLIFSEFQSKISKFCQQYVDVSVVWERRTKYTVAKQYFLENARISFSHGLGRAGTVDRIWRTK